MVSKFAPKRKDELIQLSSIDEKIKHIADSDDYYISESGTIYKEYEDGLFYRRKKFINPANGYSYALISMNGVRKTIRVHRYVAMAFIPNPYNLPVVGHIDNNKANNNVSNLYWTTYSENSQKAVDDGLLVNAKGEEDTQSMPVVCIDAKTNGFLMSYGSVSEAHRALGVSKSTILRQCNHEIKTSPRCGYCFEFKDNYMASISNDYRNHNPEETSG